TDVRGTNVPMDVPVVSRERQFSMVAGAHPYVHAREPDAHPFQYVRPMGLWDPLGATMGQEQVPVLLFFRGPWVGRPAYRGQFLSFQRRIERLGGCGHGPDADFGYIGPWGIQSGLVQSLIEKYH